MQKKSWTSSLKTFIWPGVCGLLLALLLLEYRASPTNDIQEQNSSNKSLATQTSFSKAVQFAASSVVNIRTETLIPFSNPYLNDPYYRQQLERSGIKLRDRKGTSSGSGVIASSDGHILTNNHVIKGASQILIILADGREREASIVGTDPDTDLAVLKIDLDGLTPATFTSSIEKQIGDIVLAIGNPFGIGQTVTQGIISAMGRNGLNLTTYENFIQTDAAINPGNSGGALIDTNGHLIGINNAILSKSGGSVGIGLAIPAEVVQFVMQELIRDGEVQRGWLGIQVQELTPMLAETFGLQDLEGLIVTNTEANGPAEAAGLLPGDIITHIDDMEVGSGSVGMNLTAQLRPQSKVNVKALREGKVLLLTIIVGKKSS